MKKFLALFLTLVLILSTTACSMKTGGDNNAGSEEDVMENEKSRIGSEMQEIHFSQSVNELKQYEDKTVTIKGFMSLLSPLDNSLFYLMSTPFQSCPFCVPNDETLTNTIAIKGDNVEFTTMPIQVTGKLVFEEFTDEYGYEYSYQIQDAEITVLDNDFVSNDMRIYCNVVREGYIDELFVVIDWIDQVVYYEEYGIDPDELIMDGQIDFCCYEEIKSFVENSNINGEYDNFIKLLDKTEELRSLINVELRNYNIEACKVYQEKSDEIYKDFSDFVNQFEF